VTTKLNWDVFGFSKFFNFGQLAVSFVSLAFVLLPATVQQLATSERQLDKALLILL